MSRVPPTSSSRRAPTGDTSPAPPTMSAAMQPSNNLADASPVPATTPARRGPSSTTVGGTGTSPVPPIMSKPLDQISNEWSPEPSSTFKPPPAEDVGTGGDFWSNLSTLTASLNQASQKIPTTSNSQKVATPLTSGRGTPRDKPPGASL